MSVIHEPMEEDTILVDKLPWRPGEDGGFCCSPYPKAIFVTGSFGFLLCSALALGMAIAFLKYLEEARLLQVLFMFYIATVCFIASVCILFTILDILWYGTEFFCFNNGFRRFFVAAASVFLVIAVVLMIAQAVFLPNAAYKECPDWKHLCADPTAFTAVFGCSISLPLATFPLGFWITQYYGRLR